MDTSAHTNLITRSITRPECFEIVFERHFAPIHLYLRRRVGDDLADELACETFVRAFSARARFSGDDDSVLPWLYGIAANLLKANHRREERRLRAFARAACDEHVSGAATLAGPGIDVDARLDAQALRPALANAIAGLSPRLREVLLLHAWAELSTEEIARALHCSPEAVRTRLHRARTQIARDLDLADTLTGSLPELATLEGGSHR